jgi:hypothetical protein
MSTIDERARMLYGSLSAVRLHEPFHNSDEDISLLAAAIREAEARGLEDAEALADGKWRQAVMAVYPSLLAMSDEPPIEVLSFILKEKERKAEARGLEDTARGLETAWPDRFSAPIHGLQALADWCRDEAQARRKGTR